MKTVPRLEKHVVVVAQDRNQAALTGKRDQPFQDTPAVRTAVNVIAQRDDDVVGLGIDHAQNRIQGQEAAVNVANRDGSCSRGGRHSRKPRSASRWLWFACSSDDADRPLAADSRTYHDFRNDC